MNASIKIPIYYYDDIQHKDEYKMFCDVTKYTLVKIIHSRYGYKDEVDISIFTDDEWSTILNISNTFMICSYNDNEYAYWKEVDNIYVKDLNDYCHETKHLTSKDIWATIYHNKDDDVTVNNFRELLYDEYDELLAFHEKNKMN